MRHNHKDHLRELNVKAIDRIQERRALWIVLLWPVRPKSIRPASFVAFLARRQQVIRVTLDLDR